MIKEYLSAGYPILAVKTCEPERAEKELLWELFNARYPSGTQPYNCFSWDIASNDIRQWGVIDSDSGARQLSYGNVQNSKTQEDEQYPQDIFPLRWLNRQPENTVLFVWNYHKFLVPQAINSIQMLQNYRDDWKQHQKTLVMLVPDIEIVKELDKSITIIDFDLPDKVKITEVLNELAVGNGIEIKGGAKEALTNAATGLTLFEAENAFALSFSHEHNAFDPRVVMEQKAQMVKKNACLEYSHFEETFSDIGGLDNLKRFCMKIIKSDLAKGVLLLGVPGTGKSMLAKALGNEAGIPTLSLDLGRVFGSLVGQSEGKIREALRIVDAMAPCLLFCDEVEKGLSGINSSGQTDGGVTSRVFGTFLTWLSDHKSKVFVIATCLSGDTIIQTQNGELVELKDFHGDSVATILQNGNVTHKHGQPIHRGNKEVVEIHTSESNLRCTKDHNIFVFDKTKGDIVQKQAKDIQVKDIIVSSLLLPEGTNKRNLLRVEPRSRQAKQIRQPDILTDDLAYLAGYLCGDGSVMKRAGNIIRIQVSEECKEMAQRISGLFLDIFGIKAPVRPYRNTYYMYYDSATLGIFFDVNFPGLVIPGQKNREIPPAIQVISNQGIAKFIAGLCDAEGYVKKNQVAIGLTSEIVIRKTILLLKRLGIQSTYSTYIPRKTGKSKVYRLSISDHKSLEIFSKTIPLFHPKKKGVVFADRQWNTSSCRDVPAMKSLVKELLKANKLPATILPNFRNSNDLISCNSANIWLIILKNLCLKDEKLVKLETLWNRKYVVVKTINTETTIEPVYDIVMPDEPHAFLANGLLVHNCNAVNKIPPEFFRAGRFDATFFVDLPTQEEQHTILNLYMKKYNIEGPIPNITNWTGAEVESMCRHASIMGSMSEAAGYVIPIYKSRGKEIEELRAYARGNCVPASIPQNQVKTQSARKIRQSSPSEN